MNRVVVTGLGAITPVGNNVPDTWDAVVKGKSGVARITHFDTSDYATKIAAEVKGFTPQPYLSRKEARRLDPVIHFAVAAAGQAIDDAQVGSSSSLDPNRVGVVIGGGVGGMQTMIEQHDLLLARGPSALSPFFVPSVLTNMAGAIVAQQHGFTGPNFAVTSACATGNHAIGTAMQMLRCGQVDVLVCGSAEATIISMGIAGFGAMRALSTRNDDPEHACRPFDIDRDGFVMGEGAGVLVLETLEHAQARGARVYAELVGYGSSADAYHLVAPDPEGKGAALAMQRALDDAQIQPQDIDYVNAHGTGTPLNDVIETKAIRTVFGDAADNLAITSTKAVTGHLLGGASAIEAVISVLSIVYDTIPPTANLTTPDPECDLDYVPLTARKTRVRTAMSNGFGFGGHNASIILRKADLD